MKTKLTSIGHTIICSASRLRSYFSSLQVGFGAFLCMKYGSKDLIQIAHELGFSCSNKEKRVFEVSRINHPQSIVHPDGISQFVYDNADVSVDTFQWFKPIPSFEGNLMHHPFNFYIFKCCHYKSRRYSETKYDSDIW